MGDQFLRKNRSMAFAKYLKHSIKSRGDSFFLSLSLLLSYVLILQIVKIRAAGLERDHKNDPIDVQPGNKKMTFRCRNVCSVWLSLFRFVWLVDFGKGRRLSERKSSRGYMRLSIIGGDFEEKMMGTATSVPVQGTYSVKWWPHCFFEVKKMDEWVDLNVVVACWTVSCVDVSFKQNKE